MAVSKKKNIWYWEGPGQASGTAPEIVKTKMTASQGVLMPGAPLEMSSGLAVVVTTQDTTLLGFLAGSVATPETWPITAAYSVNDEVYVAVVKENGIYAAFCDSGDADSAVAQTNVGIAYGIRVSTVTGSIGYTTIDIGDTDASGWFITDIASNREPEAYTTSDNPGVALARWAGTLHG